MKHEWIIDEDGEIDNWANGSDFHNGPVCRLCGHSFCECCSPKGYEDETCTGYPTQENTILYEKTHYYVFLIKDDGPTKSVMAYWHEVSSPIAKMLKEQGHTIKITTEKEEKEDCKK